MLMATYFLLPWVLLVGNYEWSTIKTATVTIFAMKFWTSIWAVIDVLDNQLSKVLSSATDKSAISAFFSFENQTMHAVIDLLILALYMGLPYYFLTILGWSGERGATAASATSNDMTAEGKSAGSKGSSLAENAVSPR